MQRMPTCLFVCAIKLCFVCHVDLRYNARCTGKTVFLVYDCVRAELVQSKKVLELGCGTGIVGITAACLGASAVLTDTQAVVQHAQRNVDRNVSCINDGQGSAKCAALDWEASLNSSLLLRPYDVVVGADLIYAAKDIGPLVETLGNLRQHSRDVLIILAHKERNLDILQQLIAQLSITGIAMQTVHKAGAISLYITE